MACMHITLTVLAEETSLDKSHKPAHFCCIKKDLRPQHKFPHKTGFTRSGMKQKQHTAPKVSVFLGLFLQVMVEK